jgi:aryl-alcohol dehydrogenase-like predicted oxidoreductase
MAEHFDLSVLAWAPLAAGVLTGKYTRGGERDSLRAEANEARGRLSEASLAVAKAVDEVADDVGATSAQVALAWVRAQGYRYIPIVGARKVEQIRDCMGATALQLTDAHLERLDEVSRPDLGFPMKFLRSDGVLDLLRSEARGRIDGR